jgi:protein-S-isoprenylcysteine O-methyltransferase
MINQLASLMGAIYWVSEIALSVRKRAAGSRESQLADRGSLRLLWIVIGCSVFAAFFLSFAIPEADLNSFRPARPVGILFFVLGLMLRWYAIIYLGRFFTVNVAIAADHQVIEGGPYRYIRHPSYTGALMAFLGLGLCIGNWVSLAVLLVPVAGVFLWRMHVEESALLQGLGDRYRSYMARTKRLIPGVY